MDHHSRILTFRKLNLHSNLIDKFEGIVVGDKLNDTQWQKAYILITSSEILLRNKRIQATYPINSVGEKDTVFENTYLGWIDKSNEVLAGVPSGDQVPSFIGCMQDVVINNRKITNVDVRNNTGVVEEVSSSSKNKEILHFPTEPASVNILFFCL